MPQVYWDGGLRMLNSEEGALQKPNEMWWVKAQLNDNEWTHDRYSLQLILSCDHFHTVRRLAEGKMMNG